MFTFATYKQTSISMSMVCSRVELEPDPVQEMKMPAALYALTVQV
jgi:hypothetical protein